MGHLIFTIIKSTPLGHTTKLYRVNINLVEKSQNDRGDFTK